MNLRTPRRPLLRGAASMLAAALVVACSTPDGQAASGEAKQAGAPASGGQAAAAPGKLAAATDAPTVVVYKTPTCGCCTKWVEHMQANGFRVETHDVSNEDVSAVKVANGLPGELNSCHTGLVNGYVVEGHVPADVIHRMLREKPQIAGIAVPGMPMGSPGMESPYPADKYDVVAFGKDGSQRVYESR